MAKKKQCVHKIYKESNISCILVFKNIQNITRITNIVFNSNKMKKNKKQNEKKKLTMNHTKKKRRHKRRTQRKKKVREKERRK